MTTRIIVTWLVSIGLSVFWGGYVASTLWNWFIVPLGVPAITYLHAVGISTVINAFLGSRGYSAPKDSEAAISEADLGLLYASVAPLLLLILGWLVK